MASSTEAAVSARNQEDRYATDRIMDRQDRRHAASRRRLLEPSLADGRRPPYCSGCAHEAELADSASAGNRASRSHSRRVRCSRFCIARGIFWQPLFLGEPHRPGSFTTSRPSATESQFIKIAGCIGAVAKSAQWLRAVSVLARMAVNRPSIVCAAGMFLLCSPYGDGEGVQPAVITMTSRRRRDRLRHGQAARSGLQIREDEVGCTTGGRRACAAQDLVDIPSDIMKQRDIVGP